MAHPGIRLLTLCASITPTKSKAKKACISAGFSLSDSTTWTRPRDPMINSHLLPTSYNWATKNVLEK
jgi:hypothetical protein